VRYRRRRNPERHGYHLARPLGQVSAKTFLKILKKQRDECKFVVFVLVGEIPLLQHIL
jgi:hypothetical protein